MIKYEVISTGSKGNAVVINKSVLIDCGVPFRALRDVYKDLRLVLLTHEHSDHFNRRTIRKLAQERPTLRWVCREWLLVQLVECGISPYEIDMLFPGEVLNYGDAYPSVRSFELAHNVPNCGWMLHFADDGKMVYATDTNSMDGIEAKNFDLYMLEANYTEADIVERIRRKQEAGEYCHEWDVLQNHLSREKADDWLYQNMGAHSRYVYLHEHSD